MAFKRRFRKLGFRGRRRASRRRKSGTRYLKIRRGGIRL